MGALYAHCTGNRERIKDSKNNLSNVIEEIALNEDYLKELKSAPSNINHIRAIQREIDNKKVAKRRFLLNIQNLIRELQVIRERLGIVLDMTQTIYNSHSK